MDARLGFYLLMERVVVLIVGARAVLGQEICDGDTGQTRLESTNALVPAMFVFGDSVLDAGTNSLFPSLLQANYKPYGLQYFGSGIFRTTNAESKVIPFPDQFLQFEQTKISITQTLKSAAAAEVLFSKSLFLINIGGNDLVTYLSNPALPIENFLRNMMDAIQESIGTVYKAGGRKFVLLGIGPVGCVPAVLVASGVEDGTCLESVNDLTKAFNAAIEDLVLNRLPQGFKDIKAVVGKPYETLAGFVIDGSAQGFTAGVKACCGSGLYNAVSQCARPSNLITNPPYSLCDNVDEHVFWDYFHPTERAYGLVADKFWDGGLDEIAPINLSTLVNL